LQHLIILNAQRLAGINSALRGNIPLERVFEDAKIGKLMQIERIAGRFGERSGFFAAAATYGVAIAHTRPFRVCNRRTSGEAMRITLAVNGVRWNPDSDRYVDLLDQLMNSQLGLCELAVSLARDSDPY
jgi:prophage maintenance system killer protein